MLAFEIYSFDGSDGAHGGCLNRFGVGSQIDLDDPQIGGHLGRQKGVWPDPVIFREVIIPWIVHALAGGSQAQ